MGNGPGDPRRVVAGDATGVEFSDSTPFFRDLSRGQNDAAPDEPYPTRPIRKGGRSRRTIRPPVGLRS